MNPFGIESQGSKIVPNAQPDNYERVVNDGQCYSGASRQWYLKWLLTMSWITVNLWAKGSAGCWKNHNVVRVYLLPNSKAVWMRQSRPVPTEMYTPVKVTAQRLPPGPWFGFFSCTYPYSSCPHVFLVGPSISLRWGTFMARKKLCPVLNHLL